MLRRLMLSYRNLRHILKFVADNVESANHAYFTSDNSNVHTSPTYHVTAGNATVGQARATQATDGGPYIQRAPACAYDEQRTR